MFYAMLFQLIGAIHLQQYRALQGLKFQGEERLMRLNNVILDLEWSLFHLNYLVYLFYT